jgi:hypothetical protein
MLVNHKRVARLMREDNLWAVQPKAFVVTTNAHHKLLDSSSAKTCMSRPRQCQH